MKSGPARRQINSLTVEAIELCPAAGPPLHANFGRAAAPAGLRLLKRVWARCQPAIAEASRFSSLPPEFLAALAAHESGGNPRAVRFEPAVYRRLQALAAGQSPAPDDFVIETPCAELADRLHPKAREYHLRYLTPDFAASHARALAQLPDDALRELACSWGFTQIMGYHLLSRGGTVRDLLEPRWHFHLATQLLAEFVEYYQLDPRCEFAELFRCWHTGLPYGVTTDPAYVDKGLRRMVLCRRYLAMRYISSDSPAPPAGDTAGYDLFHGAPAGGGR